MTEEYKFDPLACYDFQAPGLPWVVASTTFSEAFCYRCGAREKLVPGESEPVLRAFAEKHGACDSEW